MKRLVVADAARADLRRIASYSGREWGAVRREQYLAAIRERFRSLRLRPEIGVARPDVGKDYRSLPVGRHLISYRIGSGAIVIPRILHQRMDAKLHIPDTP